MTHHLRASNETYGNTFNEDDQLVSSYTANFVAFGLTAIVLVSIGLLYCEAPSHGYNVHYNMS